ncbi:RIP metalloprotease RseP [Lusitaniella coriacea LEGE 07157]|uniref:Zinc metalloprotease n=1 Tax=Lusitaniella coriacea LEGE 07157 TaxID=945747 RepID=A0A8J7DSW3_9CYAN|nr:RIP metalloprotease RseP [Lusitaniella coriacea]MBE9114877.1 RIP metalloprotease RseP [Lusitaniella coriacea LEGE 07157]
MSVLAAIAVLALLIVVHEFGHFSAARLQNIRVNRFSIGFGPILLKKQGPETEYAIRAFPLGGFVGFPDDDPDSEIPPDDPDLLRNRPILDRAIVISAGVIANLIFAYFLLVSQSAILGVPESANPQPGVIVTQIISSDSPAGRANLQAGDRILAIDNRPLQASEEAAKVFKQTIETSANQSLNLTVKRGKEQLAIALTPDADKAGKGKIGIGLAPNFELIRRPPNSIFEAFIVGAKEFQRMSVLTTKGFAQLIGNFQETAQQVASPVKIVQIGSDLAKSDAGSLFQFGALISINLAIINILPLPALDGGQLAFLLLEGLRGKPVPSRIQDGVMRTGLVLLLGLGMFLIVRDTTNLAIFQQLLP